MVAVHIGWGSGRVRRGAEAIGCEPNHNHGPPNKPTSPSSAASSPARSWKDEDYDVLADGEVVGRILEEGSRFEPPELRWGWSITAIVPASPGVTNGTAATRAEAMAKFRAAWEAKRGGISLSPLMALPRFAGTPIADGIIAQSFFDFNQCRTWPAAGFCLPHSSVLLERNTCEAHR
jgi:hypothetical protein